MKKLIGITLLALVILLTACDTTTTETPETPNNEQKDDKPSTEEVGDLLVKEVNDVTIELGSSLDEIPSCIVEDSSGTNVECLSKGDTVDLDKVGTYDVTYYAKNTENSKTNEVSFTVTVEDTTAPVMSVVNTFDIEVGDTNYVLPQCTVVEASDPSMVCNMVGDHNIDANKIGTTKVYFTAIDESGNLADQIIMIVTVKDSVKPGLTLANETIVINQGESVNLLEGVTASDNYDGNITDSISFGDTDTSSLDTGEYTVTYTVSDSSGNTTTETASLIVNEVLYTIGDTVSFNGLDIFVKSVEVLEVENAYSSYSKAVAIGVEVKNKTDKIHFLNLLLHSMKDQYDERLSNAFAYFDDSLSVKGAMLPNAVMEGVIVYEYTGDGSYKLKLSSLTEVVSLGFNVVDGVKDETSKASPLTAYTEHSVITTQVSSFSVAPSVDTMLIKFIQAEVKDINNMFIDAEKAVVLDMVIQNNDTDIDSLVKYEYRVFDPNGLEVKNHSALFDDDYISKGDMLPWAHMEATAAFNYTVDGTYTIVLGDILNERVYRQFDVVDGVVTLSNSDFNIGEYNVNSVFINSKTVSVGSTISFDGFDLVINSVSVEASESMFSSVDEAVILNVTVTNTSDETNSINMFYHTGFGSDGTQIGNAFFDFDTLDSEDIEPSVTVTGSLAYEYDGDGTYVFRFVDFDGAYELINVVVAK